MTEELAAKTDEELLRWIRATLAAYDQLPEAVAILNSRGMSFEKIGKAVGGVKSTMWRKARNARPTGRT